MIMGRTLLPDHAYFGGFASPAFVRRRAVLRETITALAQADPPDRWHRLAAANLHRWRRAAQPAKRPRVEVVAGDWGEVCATYTRNYGRCFAALNMANAYVPGGGYVEGSPAQEENMFRRTDCHFAIEAAHMDAQTERYTPTLTALINGEHGRVLLDTTHPRVCLRGPEDRGDPTLGYAWLAEDAVFPFYELRAAATDLRDGRRFDPALAGQKIAAQLDTLIAADVRHAVLGAFGCGAFLNPADQVARLYADALREREGAFDCVVFAIFHPGYGPDNYTPFARVFAA
jgi:hypothetical protein